MNHLTEEQLVLHYYGEAGDTLAAELHLDSCEECRRLYGSLQRVLNIVDALPVPERGPEYGADLWRRIQRDPPARAESPLSRLLAWLGPRPARVAAAAAAFAVLMVGAFLAGRFYPRPGQNEPAPMVAADSPSGDRILLVAVGDYLERSQMMLIELANSHANGPLDISAAQERASELVSESRLYRQTATHTGEAAVASVLDDLERVLLEISHSPSQLSTSELERLRHRLEAEGILFKIRVLGSNVRNMEGPIGTDPAAAPKRL